jgi:hypothetical protein
MVNLKGSLDMSGDARMSGSMSVSSVRAADGAFGNAAPDSNLSGGTGPSNVTVRSLAASPGASSSAAFRNQVERDPDLHTGQGLHDMGFFYPSTESLQLAGTRIYQARWQKMRIKAGDAARWNESDVTAPDGSSTMAYPGSTGWTEDLFVGILDGGTLSKTALNGNYAIGCSETGGSYGK